MNLDVFSRFKRLFSPGRPSFYSHNRDTKAHSRRLISVSVSVSKENKRRTLKNHTVSRLKRKSLAPGGRAKTRS